MTLPIVHPRLTSPTTAVRRSYIEGEYADGQLRFWIHTRAEDSQDESRR